MSEVKVNKISPRTNCGTVQLGDSGDTFTIPSGATINNQGTATNFGATGAASWNTTVKTGDFTAVAGEGYFVNTSSGEIDVTLPSSPSAGAVVAVADYANNFSTNNCILIRNGSKIGGNEHNAVLKVSGVAVTIVFVDSTQGWIVTDDGQRTTADSNPYIQASGGTELTCGNFKTHVFTGPGTFTVSTAAISAPDNVVEYLVVAGGGSGGRYIAGGGGAGGVRTFTTLSPATPINAPAGVTVSAQAYPITVGGGGAAVGPAGCTGPSLEIDGNNGAVSTFSTITSAGGGGGGNCGSVGLNGGSGGGAGGRDPLQGGTGNTPPTTPAQGKDGGDCPNSPTSSAGGGGGGATTEGAIRCGSTVKYGGAGGTGAFLNPSFFGPTAPSYGQAPTPLAPNGRYFGGGGGGGGFDTAQPPSSTGNGKLDNGGAGGGGSGTTAAPGGASPNNFAGESGATNTGGGGGVAGVSSGFGNQPGAGGSGIVVIRYRFQ